VMAEFRTGPMLKWLWLTVAIVVLDQISKQWVSHSLEMYRAVEIMPLLNLFLAHNPGAAFSFLSEAGGWQRWLFTLVALLVSAGLVLWLNKLPARERLMAIGLAFVLGGALGNVIDRILYGYVIDFIQFYYHAQSCLPGFSPRHIGPDSLCIWPSFNLADSAITVGAVCLILDAVMGPRRKRQDGLSAQESKHG